MSIDNPLQKIEDPTNRKSARATREKWMFGLPLLVGGGWLVLSNIALIVTMLSNTLTATLLLAAIGTLGYIVLDNKFRTIVWYGYRWFMRKAAGIFVDLDPVSIVKTYVEEMKANREKMYDQIANLKGQIKKLESVIKENQDSRDRNLAIAKKARTTGDQKIEYVKVRRAGKIQDSTLRLDDLRKKMDGLYTVLTKMYEVSGIVIEDTEEDVNLKIRERNALISGHSAFKSALRIIKGDPDQTELFEQAMDAMADDIESKKGEMETFMDMSSGFMKGLDLENQIFDDKGFDLLERYERGESLLLGYEKKPALEFTPSGNDKVLVPVNKGKSKYDDLL